MSRASSLLQSASARSKPFICLRCRQTRHITQNHLKKKEEARQQWEEWAKEIQAGTRQSMLEILEQRGFVNSVTGERDALNKLMIKKRIGAYVGIDPTAASLHVGHMLPLMALFWMHLHGFHTLSLLGGSTAKIGDPSFRTTDRALQSSAERKANLASIHYQLKRIWANLEKVGKKHGYIWEWAWHRELINNATWWNKLPMLEVLKLLGPGFRMGTMLSRDTVKSKLDSKDGMSFSEFCYPVMQAWDWWQMYDEKGIQMQIGGADQFGNIVAGVEAVKYVAKTHPDPDVRQTNGVEELTMPVGLTVPLLTTASGEKFGKSAGNAIWLDQQMTSLYDLYGFFVRTADEDVKRYLQLFTFLPLKKIHSICDLHKSDPSKRIAQHTLAQQFIELIHGEEAAKQAEAEHAAIRKQTVSSLLAANPTATTAAEVTDEPPSPRPQKTNPLLSHQHPDKRLQGTFMSRSLNKFAPPTDQNKETNARIVLPKSLIYNQPIARVLYAAGLVTSRSEGHRLAQSQGAYIGSQSSDLEQMNDQLDYVPAKLHDPSQTWRYVIRDEINQDRKGGMMHKEHEEGILILRTGKWRVRIIRIVSDELFESMNIEPQPPGWAEFKAQKAQENAEEAWKHTNGLERPLEQDSEFDHDEGGEGAQGRPQKPGLTPWDAEQKEMKRLAGQRLRPWDAFESSIKPHRKDAWAAVKEGQAKAMTVLRQRGASPKDLREASYKGWGAKKQDSDEKRDSSHQ